MFSLDKIRDWWSLLALTVKEAKAVSSWFIKQNAVVKTWPNVEITDSKIGTEGKVSFTRFLSLHINSIEGYTLVGFVG